MRLRVHLLPFFGDKVVTDITPGMVQDYRVHRMTSRKDPKTQKPLLDPAGKPLRDPASNRILKDPKTGEVHKVTLTKDEGPRYGTTFESLSKIRPAFPAFGDKSTGGNSSQVTDGGMS